MEEYSSAMQSVRSYAMRALVDCARAEKSIGVSARQVQDTHAQLREEQARAEALQRALEEHQEAMDAHHAHMEDVRVKIGGMVELEDFRRVEKELQRERGRAHDMSVELDKLCEEDANKTVMLEEAEEADKWLKEQLGRKTQEFSTLQRFLRRQTDTTQGLEKDYQALRGAFQRLETEFGACREKNAALLERLGVGETRTQQLRGAHRELMSVNAEQEKQLEVYKRTLHATQKELGDARRAMEQLSGAYKDTKSQLSGLDRDFHVSEEEMRQLRKELLSEVESSEKSRADRGGHHTNSNSSRNASRLDQDTML
jgi:chromosome segregation ATPase